MLQQTGTMTLHQSTRLSPEEQAELARQLIQANQEYNTLNSSEGASRYIVTEKLQVLLSKVESLLSQDIAQASALNLAGRIAYDLELFALAKDYFTRADNLESHNIDYMLNLASTLSKTAEPTAARALFEEVLKHDKSNINAFLGIAFNQSQTGDYAHAFLHYRYALALGYTSTLVHDQITECIENIKCEHYDSNLELLMLYMLKLEDIDTSRLIRFAAELLVNKYDLTNDECVLDIDELIQDPLLLHILETAPVADPHIEDLLTQLRSSIFLESILREGIRDETLACALSLGVYANKTDYAFVITNDEEKQIELLKQRLHQEIGGSKCNKEDMAGALILLAMFEPLYVQRFSFSLLAYDLEEWPETMHSLMQASLYDLSSEHQVKYDLFGNSITELLENNVSRARERWQAVASPGQASFCSALSETLGHSEVPSSWRKQGVRALLIACGSGKKAYRYASQFKDLNILAADQSHSDMAYAHTQAQRSHIDNIDYAVADYAQPPTGLDPFDYIEFGEDFDFRYLNEWLTLLKQDGIARVNLPSIQQQEYAGVISDLIKARGLQPTLENIRLIRNSILLEKQSGLWEKLLSEPLFYTSAGCKALLFNESKKLFSANDAASLFESAGLERLKAANASDESSELDTLTYFATCSHQ